MSSLTPRRSTRKKVLSEKAMANVGQDLNRLEAERFFNSYVDPFTKDIVEYHAKKQGCVVRFETSFTTFENLCSAFRLLLERLVHWALLCLERDVPRLNSYEV